MEDNKLYYYDGEWRSYDYLHTHYGITLSKSTPVILYDNSLNQMAGWIDSLTGEIWIVDDHRWYTSATIPYWTKSNDSTSVYLIGELLNIDIYKLRDSELFMYRNELKNFDYLHNNYGITKTPSTIHTIQDGVVKCWYNSDVQDTPYWDVDLRQWLASPIDHSGSADIDTIGSTSTFLYSNPYGDFTPYGTIVSGRDLTPVCINIPLSGTMTCTKMVNVTLTGTWRILTETARSFEDSPCIVTAIKISDNEMPQRSNNNNSESNSDTEEIINL